MNWGTKLIIALALFMGFIITLSIKMIFSSEDALIEKDYYEQGLNYNQKYDARQLAITDSVVPQISVTENGLLIQFIRPAVCKLNLKRLANSRMDTIITRQTNADFELPIMKNELASGPWMLSIDYIINKKNYLFEQEIIMP